MQWQEFFGFIRYNRFPTYTEYHRFPAYTSYHHFPAHTVAQFVDTNFPHGKVHNLDKENCRLRLANLNKHGLAHEETLRALEQWPDEAVPA